MSEDTTNNEVRIPFFFPEKYQEEVEIWMSSILSKDLDAVTLRIKVDGISSYFSMGVFLSLFSDDNRTDTLLKEIAQMPLPLLNRIHEKVCIFDARMGQVLQDKLNTEFRPIEKVDPE